VSQWWRRLVEEDMEVVIPARRRSIIHNFIDTELFSYQAKPAEQARKILWVRSAHTRKYGADLAVGCLEALRRSGQWRRFEVRIIGDGEHFSEFEQKFGRDRQVKIERRFASQDEIAALHKDYGMLLVPTRYDSQGVSRDEAMSSGLVPITNLVAAVPEFVDDTCAVLGGAEEGEGLAEGVLKVASDPELFSTMSANAAQRARRQCGAAATVEREAELLGMVPGEPLPW
jgi:glycosyltransferase involved in cell wall biosynthesis